jgi:hypothetical protein
MRPQRILRFRADARFYSFPENMDLRPEGIKPRRQGDSMYNNYLSCEVCGAELTRANQKQYIEMQTGFMHSYCQKCYSEKFPGKK